MKYLNTEARDKITNMLETYRNNFHDRFEKIATDLDMLGPGLDTVADMMKAMIFGVGDDTPIKKVDLGKNKNLIKYVLLNLPNMNKTTKMLRSIVTDLEELLYNIKDLILSDSFISDTPPENGEPLIIQEEVGYKLDDMITFFYSESTRALSAVVRLGSLLSNSGMLKFDDSYNHEKPDINTAKKDTMKRYYFNDVYDIKNGFRYFNKNKMIFGETNTIMKHFNLIIDFLFKDFIYFFNTLLVNMEYLGKKATK